MNIAAITAALTKGDAAGASLIRMVDTAINVIRGQKQNTLIDVSKAARVEPIVIISKDCVSLDYTHDVLQTLLSLFAGYYLQAVAMITTINNVAVANVLNQLNPDPELLTWSTEDFTESATMNADLYEYSLPSTTNPRALHAALEVNWAPIRNGAGRGLAYVGNGILSGAQTTGNVIGLGNQVINTATTGVRNTIRTTANVAGVVNNAINTGANGVNNRINNAGRGGQGGGGNQGGGNQAGGGNQGGGNQGGGGGNVPPNGPNNPPDPNDPNNPNGPKNAVIRNDVRKYDTKTVTEVSNLTVGKLLTVELKAEDAVVSIPVLIRLSPVVTSIESILHILAYKTEDHSFVERWHSWKSGRISFIKDLIFCQDLIDEHRKTLMHDKEGVISEITRRNHRSKLFGITNFLNSFKPSLSSASNIIVISEEVARTVEMKLGGKLSSPHIREKAFNNTYGMILCVIDRDYDRVVVYHRNIAASSNFSVKELKAANKDKGPEITDILRSYSMGAAPTF